MAHIVFPFSKILYVHTIYGCGTTSDQPWNPYECRKTVARIACGAFLPLLTYTTLENRHFYRGLPVVNTGHHRSIDR